MKSYEAERVCTEEPWLACEEVTKTKHHNESEWSGMMIHLHSPRSLSETFADE